MCRDVASLVEDKKSRGALRRNSTAQSIEIMARADPRLAGIATEWDTDAFLLGTPTVTVDLVTGLSRAPDRYDFITMCTAVSPLASVDPERDMPIFMAFLNEISLGDQEVAAFLKRWAGYCLTGDTREQKLLFIHGPGGNGKSLLIQILAGILGDYAWAAPPEMLLAAKHDRHPTELAALAGRRLVTASENESGRHWNETRIKSLTGGDEVTARFMRQDFFKFKPCAKLIIVGNNKPKLIQVDDAMRRRFQVLEFAFRPTRPDQTLADRMRPEWPAIFRWFIDGCVEWQKTGLMPPKALLKATEEYFAEQDIIQEWIDERCDLGDEFVCTNPAIRESFAEFTASRSFVDRSRDPLVELRRKLFLPINRVQGTRERGFKGLRLKQGDI